MSELVLILLILLSTSMSANSHPIDSESNVRNIHETTDHDESETSAEKLIDWNTTIGGAKWLRNCDFPGYDIKYQFMPIEKCHLKCCSQACIALSGCNAFRWNDGWCFLKNVPAMSLNRTPVSSGTCGFLPWEFHK